jgi:hypothetical protein
VGEPARGRRKQAPSLSPQKVGKGRYLGIRFGGKNSMKITTLIVALLAFALFMGTAMVVSVQTQPVVACSGPNC